MGSRQLKEFDMLLCAMDSFIRGNGNFESSMVINAAVSELEQCTSIQQCFSIPLQHKLFNMDSALKWVLFLATIPEKIIEQFADDEEFAELKDDFNEFINFSTLDSLKLIANVYDIGIQEHILSHLEDESDDDGASDEDDASDESSDEDDASDNNDAIEDDDDVEDEMLDIKALSLDRTKKSKN